MLHNLLMKVKWTNGRQEGGYKIFRLFQSKKFRFDSYLLYYPEGSEIPSHIDKVEQGKHYRINVELIKAKTGGKFLLEGKPKFKWWRVVYFCPSDQTHSVTKINKGYRLVFSIGWIK